MLDAETHYGPAPDDLPAAGYAAWAHWSRRDVAPFLPDAVAPKSASVSAYANEGRWLVDCPCGSAQIASRTDPRFFCIECLNEAAAHRWVRVTWPARADDLDAMLSARSVSEQNWTPDDDVDKLLEGFVVHPVDVPLPPVALVTAAKVLLRPRGR